MAKRNEVIDIYTNPVTGEHGYKITYILKDKISWQSFMCWRRAYKRLPEEIKKKIPVLPEPDFYVARNAYYYAISYTRFLQFYTWYKGEGRGLMREFNAQKNKAVNSKRERVKSFSQRGFNKTGGKE